MFEETLALLTDRAAAAPVLLVLEDLHWADTSTLDLVVFLAHNLDDRRVLLLATYRADEPASAERMRRLADGVRRSGSALVLELGPLEHEELTALLAARADAPLPAALTDAIVARSEGNPFFAEELLAAAGDESGELPRGLRDLLLQRVARLDRPTQSLLRLAAAAGRDVGYPLLRAVAALPERDVRESLRQAVEHGVLVADQATGSFRFRHALLAEAIYATILPGEREELHARLADELARSGGARHRRSSRRTGRRRVAAPRRWPRRSRRHARRRPSSAWRRRSRTSSGRSRCGTPCRTRPSSPGSTSPSSAPGPPSSPARRAPRRARSSSRGERSSSSATSDPPRAALLHERLGRYLFESGSGDAALAAFERAVELVPAQPPSPERAQALAALARGLMLAWRYDESLAICEQALALARAVGAREAELRALTVLGSDLAYLGRGDEGLAQLCAGPAARRGERRSRRPAARVRQPHRRADDARPAARVGAAGGGGARGDAPVRDRPARVLVANWIEALLAIGEWDEADRASAAALRAITANYPHMPLILRADLEIGRGDFDAARAHLDAARATAAPRAAAWRSTTRYVAELALWERRWTDADEAVRDGLARARPALGPPRSASGCAPRDCAHRRSWRRSHAPAATPTPSDAGSLRRATLLAAARRAAAEASADHAERRRLARPGRGRARARPRRRAARAVVRRRRRVGAARAPAARGLLPLAPGRGARRRRRAARRGERAAPGGARRRRSARSAARCCASSSCSPQRARLDLAPPDADARRPRAGPRGAPRADAARGGGARRSSPAASPTARSPPRS